MSIENRSLKLPHSSGVLCGQKRSIFGEGIAYKIMVQKNRNMSPALARFPNLALHMSPLLARLPNLALHAVSLNVKPTLNHPTKFWFKKIEIWYDIL